jgi:hypothetical protein
MGYYTIRLDPGVSKICTISFIGENISTRYYQLVLHILQTYYIFQGKMSELMESLGYVQAYLDDLLCISRNSLEDHLERLDKVLRQLSNVGSNVSTEKKHSAHLK